MKKFKFNYTVLKPGDVMLTSGYGFAARFIRWQTTQDWKLRKSINISTHTAIVIEDNGQLIGVESKGIKGLQRFSLNDYNGHNRKRFCIGFRRYPFSATKINRLHKNIAYDLRKGMEYDIRGALAFNPFMRKVFGMKDDPTRPWCSEYVAEKFQQLNIKMPKRFYGFVSPHDWQVWDDLEIVNDWKVKI